MNSVSDDFLELLDFDQKTYPFFPQVPLRGQDLGIPESVVVDIAMRRILLDGSSCLRRLSESLGLSIPVVESLFRAIRDLKYIDVKGLIDDDYHFSLTSNGRAFAQERFKLSQYAGCAPVSLQAYQESVKKQKAAVHVTRQILKQAFCDLVVPDRLLDDLGPAIVSQSSIFLYGPPGNGKSSIAERLNRVYNDTIFLPRAVEVDGQIISLFDPIIHQHPQSQPPGIDPRWVLCKRPCVLVGGELTSSMLELRLDAPTGIYSAPLQMKANNGIFIIDDFGRQFMTPQELLNRWIVPLDRQVDFLSLSYGIKFQIPFDVMVIFSTNLSPKDLGDDAFFRRIQNKIFIDPVGDGDFDEILSRVATARKVKIAPEAPPYMRARCRELGAGDLRACIPNDLCKLLHALATYEGWEPELNVRSLDRILPVYYARGEDSSACAGPWQLDWSLSPAHPSLQRRA